MKKGFVVARGKQTYRHNVIECRLYLGKKQHIELHRSVVELMCEYCTALSVSNPELNCSVETRLTDGTVVRVRSICAFGDDVLVVLLDNSHPKCTNFPITS